MREFSQQLQPQAYELTGGSFPIAPVLRSAYLDRGYDAPRERNPGLLMSITCNRKTPMQFYTYLVFAVQFRDFALIQGLNLSGFVIELGAT